MTTRGAGQGHSRRLIYSRYYYRRVLRYIYFLTLLRVKYLFASWLYARPAPRNPRNVSRPIRSRRMPSMPFGAARAGRNATQAMNRARETNGRLCGLSGLSAARWVGCGVRPRKGPS